jgi:N-acetylglucosaminyldiphosphoundecaprenol N-acetyl-beta-D-mannosaminyltransferase
MPTFPSRNAKNFDIRDEENFVSQSMLSITSSQPQHAFYIPVEPPYALPERIGIGPLRIDSLSAYELTRRLIGHTFTPGKTNHVVTANAQIYVLAEEREEFRRCVGEAEYVCADGISVAIACKWLGRKAVARIAGVDLISYLCAEAVSLDLTIYFLGGNPGSAAKTASIMMKKFPGLRVAGISCPPLGFIQNADMLSEVLESIVIAKPSIIYVALGVPRQEFFIRKYIRPLGIPVAVGVGGSFEIICGVTNRAPSWMRQSGLEWLYRWAQEPVRLANRYLIGNSLFLFYLMRNLVRQKTQPEGQAR